MVMCGELRMVLGKRDTAKGYSGIIRERQEASRGNRRAPWMSSIRVLKRLPAELEVSVLQSHLGDHKLGT